MNLSNKPEEELLFSPGQGRLDLRIPVNIPLVDRSAKVLRDYVQLERDPFSKAYNALQLEAQLE